MENQRTFIENWTYRWNEEEQRYVRAYRRDPVVGPDPLEVEGVPQHQSTTTQTVSFAGTNFRLRPATLFPRRPIAPTRPTSAPARPPAPVVTEPAVVRPNTSLGQIYYTDGTVSAPETSTSTGQRVTRSRKRTRVNGDENEDEGEESPRSRARWVSPSRHCLMPPPARIPSRQLVRGHHRRP